MKFPCLIVPPSNVPKQPTEGNVVVDHKAIYIGKHSNWRYPWKHISNVVFEGRQCLTITCDDGKSVECVDNSEDSFSSFQEQVLKFWHKKQGKKAAKAAEQERESRPPVKKRKTYGKTSRSYAKPPRVSMTMTSRADFSSDEEDTTFEKTKSTLKRRDREGNSSWMKRRRKKRMNLMMARVHRDSNIGTTTKRRRPSNSGGKVESSQWQHQARKNPKENY